MRRSRIHWLGLAALFLAACTSSLPATIVVGRHESPPSALWDRTVSALRQAGYEPVAANPARGQLAVESRSRPTAYGARFELQLFRQGWVQVRLSGPLVRPAGGAHVQVPNDLAQEYEAFVLELMRILGTRQGDAETPSEAS